jgi:hypothetical protein
MFYNRIIFTIGLSLFVLTPRLTLAEASSKAVPLCESGVGSVFCVNNIFVMILALTALFAVLMCVIAGFMFAVGSRKDRSKAKEMLSATLVAVVIAASAFVLLQAVDSKYTTLERIESEEIVVNTAPKESELSGLEPKCHNCINVVDLGVPVAEWANVYVTKSLALKLKKLSDINKNWRITEAYPPTVDHISPCHRDGTCVDIGIYPRLLSAARISELCRDLKGLNINITNEYGSPTLNQKNSFCPAPLRFETTLGGHLHLR